MHHGTTVGARTLLSFSSNDYLGLAGDGPGIREQLKPFVKVEERKSREWITSTHASVPYSRVPMCRFGKISSFSIASV